MLTENPPQGATVKAYVYGNPYVGPTDVEVGDDPYLTAAWRMARFWETMRPTRGAITDLIRRRKITGTQFGCSSCPIAVLIQNETNHRTSVPGLTYYFPQNMRTEEYPLPNHVTAWIRGFDGGLYQSLVTKGQ